jgi:hypothetical protein
MAMYCDLKKKLLIVQWHKSIFLAEIGFLAITNNVNFPLGCFKKTELYLLDVRRNLILRILHNFITSLRL